MSGPPHLSRTSSIASADASTSTSSTALLGATRAFAKPQAQRHTGSHRTASSNGGGALAGASTAAGESSKQLANRSLTRSTLPFPGSPAGCVGDEIMDRKAPALDFANMPHLGVPSTNVRPGHTRSPSHQAAVLATRAHPPAATAKKNGPPARSRAETTAKPAVAPKPRRLSEHIRKIEDGHVASDKPTDDTSIAPTTSLVDLFEQRLKGTQEPRKKPEPIVINPSTELTIRSPKPVMPAKSGITSMIQLELAENRRDSKLIAQAGSDTAEKDTAAAVRKDSHGSDSGDSFVSASETQSPADSPTATANRRDPTQSQSPGQALQIQTDAKRRPPPSPSPLAQQRTNPIQIQLSRKVSATQSDGMSLSSSRSRSIPAQFHQAYPRRMTPQMTGDELANALVASSLASSRAPSPTRLEPPPVPGRHKKGHHHHHRLSFHSRTPSPAKAGMLHTLRKADGSSSESEDDPHPYAKHKKKRLVRKHPNKHHEGDRKRWRDAVTERERKRYEGVWAANKGLHCSFTLEEQDLFVRKPQHQKTILMKEKANDQVSNIIARDIWNRSRLPEPTLEMVWDLVDTDAVGRLQKDEFVVGMWLIDQRLKGRKLPVKVSETVWASVRGISGIKVRHRK